MFLRLGSREVSLRFLLLAAGAIAVLSVAITVSVIMVRRSTDNEAGIDESAMPAEGFGWIGLDDFVVEDELARGSEPQWVPFRARKERWSEADVQEHWIDPREIGIDVLETRVDADIRRKLEDVP